MNNHKVTVARKNVLLRGQKPRAHRGSRWAVICLYQLDNLVLLMIGPAAMNSMSLFCFLVITGQSLILNDITSISILGFRGFTLIHCITHLYFSQWTKCRKMTLFPCPSGGTSEPTASLPYQTQSRWSKDESVCQDDPLSGVLGSSQALC